MAHVQHSAQEVNSVAEDEEQLLTPAEAARRLHASEETIRRWLRANPPRIRGIQLVTGRWRIPKSEIDRMLSGVRQLQAVEDDEKKAAA
jgi:excisionase family DNA binding protein